MLMDNMSRGIILLPDGLYFLSLCKALCVHYKTPKAIFKTIYWATLKENYSNTPWAGISVLQMLLFQHKNWPNYGSFVRNRIFYFSLFYEIVNLSLTLLLLIEIWKFNKFTCCFFNYYYYLQCFFFT